MLHFGIDLVIANAALPNFARQRGAEFLPLEKILQDDTSYPYKKIGGLPIYIFLLLRLNADVNSAKAFITRNRNQYNRLNHTAKIQAYRICAIIKSGGYMNITQLHEGIRDINMTYLMLAQQMINEDKPAAIFRLGIGKDLLDVIANLTPPQIIKMAASNMLLCRFRFDEKLLLKMVTDYSKDRLMSQSHAAILMSAQGIEELA